MPQPSPVGTLILDAEARAQKKASKAHSSTSPCGCEVSVTWFSEHSRSTKIEPCAEHAHPAKTKNGAKR